MLIIRAITLTILFAFLATLPSQTTNATVMNAENQFNCNTVSQIPQSECKALVAFYENTNGSFWVDSSGWLVNDEPCNWYGLTCEDGHITELNLNKNGSELKIDEHTILIRISYPSGIVGEIPPEIGDLSHLTALRVSFSSLTKLPAEIGRLDNLTTLDLRMNLLKAIPPEIGSLTNLEALYLTGNELSLLPVKISNLVNLEILDLRFNQLSAISTEIGNLTKLTEFYLDANQLNSIPSTIGNLENLNILNIASNQLNAVPAEIGNLINLTTLILHSNQLTTIPTEIGNLIKLTDLYLDTNQLSTIPDEIGNLIDLTTLYLSSNELATIPPTIGNLLELENLYLNANQLSAIPSEISNLENLVELDLAHNSIIAIDEGQRTFFNQHDTDWLTSQTVAPADLSAKSLTDTIIELSWSPIAFNGRGGYYEVSIATDGPFMFHSIAIGEDLSPYIIGNFDPDTTYFFRIHTYRHPHAGTNSTPSVKWDDQHNGLWSEPSEAVSVTTSPPMTPTPPTPPCAISTTRKAFANNFVEQFNHIYLPAIMTSGQALPRQPERLGIREMAMRQIRNSVPTAFNPNPNANTSFTLSFEEGMIPPCPTFDIWVTEDGLPTIMHDDGTAGDSMAGDGVYTAIVVLNSEESELLKLGVTPTERALTSGIIVEPDQALIIKDTSVVDDEERTFDLCEERGNPNGIWAFKKLIMDMANTDDETIAANFVENWWQHWSGETHLSNGNKAGMRSAVIDQVLNRWTREEGRLDLDAAPFRLLAIVPRLDLRKNPTPTSGNAGEFRFVWGVLNPADPCGSQRFTIIFEYAMPAQNTTQILAWAKQVHGLQEFDFGPDYNTKLEAISSQITKRDAQPLAPNGSAIMQVRTNEFLNMNTPWELREFVLSENRLLAGTSTRPLILTTVKQTPDLSINNTLELADFIKNNITKLLHVDPFSGLRSPIHKVPDNLLAAKSQAFFKENDWQSEAINDNEARHQFALMTCNGCHTQETGTTFLHIEPREPLTSTTLSKFLIGGKILDPISSEEREFNDLERRGNDLLSILHSTRFEIVGIEGLQSRIH